VQFQQSVGRAPGSVVSATQNPKIPNTARVPKLFVLAAAVVVVVVVVVEA